MSQQAKEKMHKKRQSKEDTTKDSKDGKKNVTRRGTMQVMSSKSPIRLKKQKTFKETEPEFFNLKAIFNEIDKEELIREDMAVVEADEIGFREDLMIDDKETNKNQDNNSEFSDGELKGDEKNQIFK